MEEVEIWRDIPEYEGLYQVSTFGNVKSLPRNGTKGGILKPSKVRGGYLRVVLCKNNKVKSFFVHRLVALAFIKNDNPTEKNEINHLDENKQNNHYSNLCWCSRIENNNYGTRNERASKAQKGKPRLYQYKPILQYTLDGDFIKDFDSIKSASLELGIDSSSIGKCCKDKLKSTGGFIWKYKEI